MVRVRKYVHTSSPVSPSDVLGIGTVLEMRWDMSVFVLLVYYFG